MSLFRDHLLKLEPGADFTESLPRITSSSGRVYYAKFSASEAETEQFIGEAESLKHIAIAAPNLAPHLLSSGSTGDGRHFFIADYLEFTSLKGAASRKLAQRLALELHAHKSENGFGFAVPTYCGRTRLQNGWFESWQACFAAQTRDLLSQLSQKGANYARLVRKGEEVCSEVIPQLLGPLEVSPVLLHGDLWSGNVGETSTGDPVIFDPASYYGHNEADLAIARIFGGSSKGFFETYHRHLPKTEPVAQYELRAHLYELFHYLNHTLLFGGYYASTAEQKMDLLLGANLDL
ncbi:Fructosamine kinase PKL/CAK/FruK [Mycena indigotica]|uniref:protein-ribulosamine 3-kinase n=1 Tax=Mycena indigotica TaxID=2126181 RepID=A0A8H6WC79_9AGAR|nr:Fructosamine kinase PKL/CAK/FruK [Mycena indigotica]KAF7307074.1 Fructosamine kinase PKL/CAK/FruK [Mycena indigotica]